VKRWFPTCATMAARSSIRVARGQRFTITRDSTRVAGLRPHVAPKLSAALLLRSRHLLAIDPCALRSHLDETFDSLTPEEYMGRTGCVHSYIAAALVRSHSAARPGFQHRGHGVTLAESSIDPVVAHRDLYGHLKRS
jgi:hypothetical protein